MTCALIDTCSPGNPTLVSSVCCPHWSRQGLTAPLRNCVGQHRDIMHDMHDVGGATRLSARCHSIRSREMGGTAS